MAVPFVLWILTKMGKSFSARPAIAFVYIKLSLTVLIPFATVAPTMGKQKLSIFFSGPCSGPVNSVMRLTNVN